MENNLTLEEASLYLPFNLNFVLTHDKTDDFCDADWYEEEKFKKGAIWQLCGYAPSDLNIYIGEGTIDGFLYRNDMTYVNFNSGIKPLLRPLSDLTKEIEVDGEKFVPMERLFNLAFGGFSETNIKQRGDVISCENCIDKLIFHTDYLDFKTDCMSPDGETDWSPTIKQFELMQQLFKWHFDVFGLIEKGKSININTINLK